MPYFVICTEDYVTRYDVFVSHCVTISFALNLRQIYCAKLNLQTFFSMYQI